jgi:hypothetical protein
VDEYFWESFQKGRFSSSLHKKVKKLNHEQKCILFMCVHTQHSPNYLDNQLKGIILKPSSQICIELIELGLLEPFTRGSNNVNINTQVQQILQKNSGWFSDIYPSIIKQDDIFPPPRKIH